MELFLNVLLFNVLAPYKGKNKKVIGENGVGLLNPLEVVSDMGEVQQQLPVSWCVLL